MGWLATLVLACALPAAGESTAPAPAVEVRGSVRGRLGVFSGVVGDDYSLELRARPELFVYLRDGLAANLTVRGQRNWGAGEERLGSGVELDRAYLDVSAGRWDLRLGRQAINFGQAQVWNPVDLVDSNTPLDFAIVKEGLDAVRAAYALSPTASVTALAAFAGGGTISLLRAETVLGGAEVGVLAARDARADDTVIGFDVKGDLGVGWWAEAAYHDLDEADDFGRFVVGIDYSFPVRDQLYLALELYHDSSGGTGVADYDYASVEEGRRFLARRYASLIGRLAIDGLTAASASSIFNLEDDSYVVTAGLARYFFENLEVTARASLFRGSGPGEFNPVAGSPALGRQPTEVWELYAEWRF